MRRAAELKQRALDAGVEILAPAPRSGSSSTASSRSPMANTLLRIRAAKVVVASGIVEQPLVFPGNDLVGVMLPEGVRRLVNLWSIKPAERAFVLTADDRGLAAAADLEAAGVELAGVARPARRPAAEHRSARSQGPGRSRLGQREAHALRPASSCPAARSRTTSSSPRRARASRTTTRAACSSRPTCPRTSRRSAPSRATSARPPCRRRPRLHGREVVRLLLRGPDGEGPEVRDRRGLRLDRALEAVHDRDDGALPGPPVPRQLDPRLREGDRARRERDRHDDRPPAAHARSPWGCSPGGRRSPSSGPRSTTSTRRSAARMMWTGAWKRPHSYGPDRGRRGTPRPPRGRPDRRLDARQAPRHRPAGRRVPRPGLPEPHLRPQGRPDPLRRADRRCGPDHGRRHDRAARRRDVLRDDDLDRRRRRLPVAHVVERRLDARRPVRPAHGRRRRDQRRRTEGTRAHAARLGRRLLERGPRLPRRASRPGRRRPDARAPDRLRRRARATSSTSRARTRSTSGTRCSSRVATSTSRRSGSSRSGSSGSRRAT